MTDLHRIVTAEERAEIANDGLGTTWDAEQITVADVIAGMAGIGYGGHFDECSDEEHAAHEIMARYNVGAGASWEVLDAEISAIHSERHEYMILLRDAVATVAWPPPGGLHCDRHGGPWGDDLTCPRCTYPDGTVRPPLDDAGPLS